MYVRRAWKISGDAYQPARSSALDLGRTARHAAASSARCTAAGMIRALAVMVLIVMFAALPLPYTAHAAIEPTIDAKAGIVYCENTGEVVFSKEEDKVLPPYSVTKLMTAIVTVMHTPLDQKVKVSKKAASVGGSTAGLKAGEEATVEQLLYAALLKSGNDAAYALAEASYGSVDKFVKQMNRTAENIGCKNTHFSNPAGIADKKNYTSPADLLLIMKIAFDNETISEIAGTEKYMMEKTNKSGARVFQSGAFSLDESVYAGKNGQWFDEATTAVCCDVNGLKLYIILLGDTSAGRQNDVKALLKYSTDKIQGVLAVKGGEKAGVVRIRHGQVPKLDVYTAEDGYAYIPTEGSRSLIKTRMKIDEDVTAPVKAGDQVGVIEITVGGEAVNEVPLVIRESVPEGWPTSYLGISDRAALVMMIAVAAALAVILMILILRIINTIRRKRARRKKAMEIARREMEEEEERNRRGWDV